MSDISLNVHSQQYAEEQRARDLGKRKAKAIMVEAERVLEIAGQEVKGLCPKKDSCPTCRAARMADKGYMALVQARLEAWGKYSALATRDNAIAHDCLNWSGRRTKRT